MNVLKTLEKLPEICASTNLTDGAPIMIRRGVSGYYPAPPTLDVDGFNARHNVSLAQRTAMEIGSMFGWEVPGADPDQHGREGLSYGQRTPNHGAVARSH